MDFIKCHKLSRNYIKSIWSISILYRTVSTHVWTSFVLILKRTNLFVSIIFAYNISFSKLVLPWIKIVTLNQQMFLLNISLFL